MILVILILIFTLILIKSAEMTVVSLKKVAGRTGIIGLSAVVIALGTSFPEIFVSITSAVEERVSLSLGVALGSNIANIALVGAGTALLLGRVHIAEKVVKKVVWISLACGILPYLLLIDGNLNRIDGVILLSVYIAYILSFFRGYHQRALEESESGISFTRLIKRVGHFAENKWKSFATIFVGIALMLFSADTIVKFSNILADRLNIPIFVIGLFILAIGTSLPEFAFSLESLKDKEPEMFIGNLSGSIVANTTLVIGLSAIINPASSLNVGRYIVPGITFVVTYLLFYYFIRTKKRLERWEAAILVSIYILFFLLELG